MMSMSSTSGALSMTPFKRADAETRPHYTYGNERDEQHPDERNVRSFPSIEVREIREFRFFEVAFFP